MQCNKVIFLWYFLINFIAELISGIVDAPVDNVPAAAGPEAEPLGRAEVEPAGEVPADPVVDAGV